MNEWEKDGVKHSMPEINVTERLLSSESGHLSKEGERNISYETIIGHQIKTILAVVSLLSITIFYYVHHFLQNQKFLVQNLSLHPVCRYEYYGHCPE